MNRFILTLTGVGLSVSAAIAGPLDKKAVPKSAQWVVHFDMEACMASTFGKYIADHRAELGLEDLDKVKAEMGIDPLADIKGVTVYGTGPDEQDGVAIFYATGAVDTLVKSLREKEKSFEQITVNGLKLYSWNDGGETRLAQVREDGKNRVVIAAADQEHLLAGIAVLDGKTPHLKDEAGTLGSWSPKAGSIVFGAATGLSEAKSLPFQHADGVTFDAGETEQELYADLNVAAKSEQEARNMSQVAQGAVAMARIGLAGNPEFKDTVELLDGLTLTCDGKRITGKFRFSSAKLSAALTELNEAKDQKRHHSKPRKTPDTKDSDVKDHDGDKD